LVQSVYDRPDISIDEALREVWRAASNRSEANLAALLSEPIIGRFAGIADSAASPSEAFQEANRFVADNKVASLASEIAKRAVIQSAGTELPQQRFLERLFAEATNYLVARDLPGHITPGSRLQNISDARRFSQSMMDTAIDAVRRTQPPTSTDDNGWSTYVQSVIQTIRRRRQ
jgi:hypothetical protein